MRCGRSVGWRFCGWIGAVSGGDLEWRAAGRVPRVRGDTRRGASVDDEGCALWIGRRRRREEGGGVEIVSSELDELDGGREGAALDREKQGVRGRAVAVERLILTHRAILYERAHLRGAVVEHRPPERTDGRLRRSVLQRDEDRRLDRVGGARGRIARAEARRSVGRHPMGRIPARIGVLRPGRRRSCDVFDARERDVQHLSTNTSFSRHSKVATVCSLDSIYSRELHNYIPIVRRRSQYAYEKKTPVYRRVFLIELIIRR